ncbi:MFS transporter [Limobrevibacterium gyesilva]|uniref:MFS transporter n=1 Tax=Limobrevibacterium gyesilva TaxID=2991712 RepID=A0AA41YKV6_9PROT|nr:MFS transporter [Limobrevibacterium gyesilva]MCW3473758.1 MFS transporter [Limobrevibacterium gyesilva]
MRPDARAAAVAIAGLCTFLNLYTPQAILPALADSFAVPLPRTGLTITAPLLAVALVAPFVGTISDRLGRKRLIVAACFGLAVPTLLIAGAGSLDAMVALRFVQGLMLPFIFAVTVAYIGDECPGGSGIRAAGSYAQGTIFGGFAGRFVAGVAADLGGWRMAFVVIGAVTVLAAVAVAALLPRERNFHAVGGGVRGTLRTYREHLTNPRLLATCGVGFGMLFSMVATFTYVNFYLAAPPFGLAPAQLGLVFTVYLLGMVTTSAATRLAVRIGRRRTMAIVVSLASAGLLLTLAPSLPLVIAGLAGLAGGLFVVQALSLGFIAASVPRAKSTAVGLYVTTYYIGGALGGVVPGLLWHLAGWAGVVGLLVPLLAAVLGLALSFWHTAPA